MKDSTMDFSWMFADDEAENSIFYLKMPFGSPGEESLECGLQTITKPKERLMLWNDTLTAAARDDPADPTGSIQTLPDFEVDAVTDCFDSSLLNEALESIGLNITVSSNDVLSPEPKETLPMAVASGLFDSDDAGYEYGCEDTEWMVSDAATPEIYPVAHTRGSREIVRTIRIGRKPRTKQYRGVSRGIHKSPNKTGQPFRVPLFHQDCLHPVVLQRCPKSVKGLTMCLRTLLRQLLAGSGWIVEASIRKDEAFGLIKMLIGPDIDSRINIELPITDAPHLPDGWKEMHYTAVLAEIISLYTGTRISNGEVEKCFMLYTGSYSPSPRFISLLGDKQWPPHLPREGDLRALGCYRLHDATWKKREAKCSLNAYRCFLSSLSE